MSTRERLEGLYNEAGLKRRRRRSLECFEANNESRKEFEEMEDKICITKEEYADLIRKAERIDTVERIYRNQNYLSTDDVLSILEIEKKGEDDE